MFFFCLGATPGGARGPRWCWELNPDPCMQSMQSSLLSSLRPNFYEIFMDLERTYISEVPTITSKKKEFS